MARKSLTPTQRLRNNLKRQIKRMEDRGYRIDDQTKEKVATGKFQTLNSLARKNYGKLYDSSTALTDEGDIVGGSEYRQIEKELAKAHKKELRERRKEEKTFEQNFFEFQRQLQDKYDLEDARLYQEGDIAYNEIKRLIKRYPGDGSIGLEKALTHEIEKYGEENVIMSIGQMPKEMIEAARTIMYYEGGSDAIHKAYIDFFEMIKGTKLSTDELKDIGDTLDKMTDFESR